MYPRMQGFNQLFMQVMKSYLRSYHQTRFGLPGSKRSFAESHVTSSNHMGIRAKGHCGRHSVSGSSTLYDGHHSSSFPPAEGRGAAGRDSRIPRGQVQGHATPQNGHPTTSRLRLAVAQEEQPSQSPMQCPWGSQLAWCWLSNRFLWAERRVNKLGRCATDEFPQRWTA